MNAKGKLPEPPEPEIQHGSVRGRIKDERMKRSIKQHPQRDEPVLDSVEPEDLPPARAPRKQR
jgi:hypothetical protein